MALDVKGSVTYTPEGLKRELTTRVGDAYSPAVLDNDLRRLLDTGRYRSVRWEGPRALAVGRGTSPAPPDGDGVALTLVTLVLVVEERPILAEVAFQVEGRGRKVVGKEKLKEEAEKLRVEAGPRERYVESRAFRLARRIEDTYREASYFRATVRHSTEASESRVSPSGLPCVKLVFEIEEGERAPLKGARFVGNRAYTDRQLWKVVKSALARSAGGGGSRGYERLRFGRVLRSVQQEMYRSRGYLDATVWLQGLELFTYDPPFGKKKQWLVVHVEVDEGPVYTVGKVAVEVGKPSVEGDEGPPLEVGEEEIMAAITSPGEEFPEAAREPVASGEVYSERTVALAARRVRTLLGRHGRINSRVTGRPVIPEEGTVIDVRVRVEPSRPYRVGDWTVRGNHKTRPIVFLRELWHAGVKHTRKDRKTGEVIEGDLIDQRKLDLAKRNIMFTGLVKHKINETTGDFVRPAVAIRTFPRDDGFADLAVDVNEGETGMLQLSASVNSDGDTVGMIEFSQRNFDIFGWPRSLTDWSNAFSGAGQTLSLSASFGGGVTRRYLRADFEEPYFLNQPVSLGVGFFDIERSPLREYSEGRVGGKVSLSRSWSLHPYKRRRLGVFGRLTHEGLAVDVTDDAENLPGFDDDDSRLLRGRIGVHYDSRDTRYNPSSGWDATLSQEYVGGPLGGDEDFDATKLSLRRYWRLAETRNDLPFIFQLRVNAVKIAGADVPFYERQFAGGIFSLRGFRTRSVGPRYDKTLGVPDPSGTPVGGEFMLLENAELTFPISGDGTLRGSWFYDAGNVWERSGEFDFRDQKQSAGFGLLIYPPGWPFPISFYWGWIINQKPEDRSERFSFMFGTMFSY